MKKCPRCFERPTYNVIYGYYCATCKEAINKMTEITGIVRRFSPSKDVYTGEPCVGRCDNGELVAYEDYEKISDENKKLKAKVDALTNELLTAREVYACAF